MANITYEQFKKMDIRIAEVVGVSDVKNADKLLKLTLNVGDLGQRTIVAGLKGWYKKKELKGKLILYLANLEPKKIRGVESQGMLLAADDGRPFLITPDEDVAPGAEIK